jgi:glycosyltransferase involved in cell wall biosynthesis
VRLGIVCLWFNRGQAVVGRQLRSALDELGHDTFVLARPSKPGAARPDFVDAGGVWDQPGITRSSSYWTPTGELLDWAEERELDAVLFDQNYEFDAVRELRRTGRRTIGRFVWEQFGEEHVAAARDAFDVVYSMTDAERCRYREMGIDSPRVHWGCHPELLAHGDQGSSDQNGAVDAALDGDGATVTFYFPGGFLTRRKPIRAVLEAFSRTTDPRLRLCVKAQVEKKVGLLNEAAERDPRIELVLDDLPEEEHLRLFAAADACLAPSRWEGLGLHFFEAAALGVPVVTNDNPPMNEVVRDGENGILVRGLPSRVSASSGLPAFDPDVDELARAIERLGDDELRASLAAGARRMREELRWDRTLADLRELLAHTVA